MEPNRKRSRNDVPPANGATYEEYSRTLEALIGHLGELKAMTERYPIFLMVAGTRYRFESPEELDEFVGTLRAAVESYRSARAAG